MCESERFFAQRQRHVGATFSATVFRMFNNFLSIMIIIIMMMNDSDNDNNRVLSIMRRISEISVGIQMEKSVSVSSDRNIRDHLWRWSTYFGWNIPTEIRRCIFDKPEEEKKW